MQNVEPKSLEPFDELLDLWWRRNLSSFTEEESMRLTILEAGGHEALLDEIWKKINGNHGKLTIYERVYYMEHDDPALTENRERVEACA